MYAHILLVFPLVVNYIDLEWINMYVCMYSLHFHSSNNNVKQIVPEPKPLINHPHIFTVLIVFVVKKKTFMEVLLRDLLFLSLYVFACMSWWIFILDSHLANYLEKKLSFAFLLWLWCRSFTCVLLSLWCLGRKVLGNCIDSWSMPSF